MKGPTDVTDGLLMFERVVTEHNAKAQVPLSDQTMLMALMRIVPPEVSKKIILDNENITSVNQLKERLEAYRIGHLELDALQGRVDMDLSVVAAEGPNAYEAKFLAMEKALEKKMNEISSMFQGKGAGNGQPNQPGKGAWGAWNAKGGLGRGGGLAKGGGKRGLPGADQTCDRDVHVFEAGGDRNARTRQRGVGMNRDVSHNGDAVIGARK